MASLETIVLTSGTSWTVPSDWNNDSNTINCIGAGASGTSTVGGAGGAFASISNIALTPGTSIPYQVGTASSEATVAASWFGSTSTVSAAGSIHNTPAAQSASVGTVTYVGGYSENGSGAGAAGPSGPGMPSNVSTAGTGDNGAGGAGAASNSGASGGSGTEWGTAGSGGGGANGGNYVGGDGGLYGGGGGASNVTPGSGAAGVIVIQYTPAPPAPVAITTEVTPGIPTHTVAVDTAHAASAVAFIAHGTATYLPRGASIIANVVRFSAASTASAKQSVASTLTAAPAIPSALPAELAANFHSIVAPWTSVVVVNTPPVEFVELPPNPALQSIIPSYLYREYADDANLAAFVAAHNALAQVYLDWFNQTPLALYTNPNIAGPLLDWVGQGLYDIARPILITSATSITQTPYDSVPYDTAAYDGNIVTGSGVYARASDDIYKRVLTWNLYRGDGPQFTLGWLKNRIARFLFGTGGSDVTAQNFQPSVTVSGATFTATAPQTDVYLALQQAYAAGALAFPFAYQLAFTTSP